MREEEAKRQYLDKVRKTNRTPRESVSRANSERDVTIYNSREGDKNVLDLPNKLLQHASTDIRDIGRF